MSPTPVLERGEDLLLTRADAALRGMGGPGDVFITSRGGEYTRFAGARIHQPQAIDELQLMARALSRAGSARAATSRLDSAEWAGQEARSMSAQLQQRDATEISLPEQDSSSPPELEVWDEGAMGFDATARGKLAEAAISRARAVGASAHGMLARVVVEMAVANSAGLRRYARASEVYYSVLFRLGDGSGYRSDLARGLRRLDPDRAIEEALADAISSQRPEPLARGQYDVVLGPLAVGDMLGFFGGLGFTGDAVERSTGLVVRCPGAQVTAGQITIRDDATANVGLPIPFDLEGVSKRVVVMIDNGAVGEPVTDLTTAARLGRASTGHAHIGREQPPAPTPANLVLTGGTRSTQALVEDVERGLLISRFHYTRMVDPESSTFTGVIRDACFTISSGAVGGPVAPGRFTEAILPLLSRCDGVGDTLVSQPLPNVWNGVASAPALRIRRFHMGFR
ncbi:MAG: TldD/PmbA family protein [Acidimicrobiales bacterium]